MQFVLMSCLKYRLAYNGHGAVVMKSFDFVCTVRRPSKETEDKYLAEIPALPGYRAWGDTRAEALDYIRSVAVAFLESYEENGDDLPPDVLAAEVG